MTAKCLNLSYLFKASVGSINGSFTEGNVSTVKKITLPDGGTIPYVSGQSLRHIMRERLEDDGYQLSPLFKTEEEKGVDVSAGKPQVYIDDDLFGYMIASKKENRRRTAPVRVSPAVGVFQYRGDRDLGTKSKETTAGAMEAGGNMFETEIYYNFFRATVLIELDRVSRFRGFELSKDVEDEELPDDERTKRVNALLNTIGTLWGGGKQSRILTDMSPKFLVGTLQTRKCPLFLEGFDVTEKEELVMAPIVEILIDHKPIIEKTVVGLRSGVFANEDEIRTTLSEAGYPVKTIQEAMANVKMI